MVYGTGDNLMDTGQIQISRLSTEYVSVPVQATQAGAPYNPINDIVQFAFLINAGAAPQNTDWVNGSWDTMLNYNYPYVAKCLVGPSGVIALATGTYVIWVKITDSPEVPVREAGTLQIV